MKIIVFFVLVFSVSSAMAQEVSRENILPLYKKSLDGFFSESEIEQRYNALKSLDAKVDDKMLEKHFMLASSLASLKGVKEKVIVMRSLVYACLNEATKESVYRKCVDTALAGMLDDYYGKHYGEDGSLDVLIESFFEIQIAFEELNPS